MSFLGQLKELFPNIREDFLEEICSAYSENEIDIDLVIDLILTYKNPPLKKTEREEICTDHQITQPIPDEEDDLEYNLENTFIYYLNKPILEDFVVFIEEIREVENDEESHGHCSEIKEDDFVLNEGDTVSAEPNDIESTCLHPSEGLEQYTISRISKFQNVDSKFALLSKIFPDAEHAYLLSKCFQIIDQEDLLEFISQSLDNRSYPKKQPFDPGCASFMCKFECTIDQFLKEIPDPISMFVNNDYNRTGYEANAEFYLMSRYDRLSYDAAEDLLIKHTYNLATSSTELETEGHAVTAFDQVGKLKLHHQPSIYFHKEVWYIEHRREIHNTWSNEEVESEPPLPVNEVFECEICRVEIEDYAELGTCNKPNGHLFCRGCILRHVEILFAEGETAFACLHNCGGFLDIQTIKDVLPVHTYDILMDKIQEEEIRSANMESVETCPFCYYAYDPNIEDNLFYCENPKCKKISCRLCQKEDHSPNQCRIIESEDEEMARHYIENKMTDALIRKCYQCNKSFVKETGCNKMTCKCGAIMCYICRKPVVDYTHFNGQGGDHYDRCELYSNDEILHDQPVADSAKQAIHDLIVNNPGLQLDANKLVPK